MLGQNLLDARLRTGLSQGRVARSAGISTFTYQKMEKGESNPGTPANPRLQTIVSLALVLRVDISRLIPEPTADIVALVNHADSGSLA